MCGRDKCVIHRRTQMCRKVGWSRKSELGGCLSRWVASMLEGWLWVSKRHPHTHTTSRPPKWQSVRNLRVFAADPYTLAQHFLNLSSVFFDHKWISSLLFFFPHHLSRIQHPTATTKHVHPRWNQSILKLNVWLNTDTFLPGFYVAPPTKNVCEDTDPMCGITSSETPLKGTNTATHWLTKPDILSLQSTLC